VLLLAGITTGHKIGLAVVAAVFIGFALSVSFIASRRRPDFPGKNGLGPFIIASVFLFAAMLTSVVVFGKEKEAKGAPVEKGTIVHVTEVEFKITLSPAKVKPGPVTFDVKNAGKVQHDLAIQGGKKTPLINPGSSATLTTTLKTGATTVYCSVPGHRQLGMVAKLTVS
jgi:nitrite reductase (NO-forming)